MLRNYNAPQSNNNKQFKGQPNQGNEEYSYHSNKPNQSEFSIQGDFQQNQMRNQQQMQQQQFQSQQWSSQQAKPQSFYQQQQQKQKQTNFNNAEKQNEHSDDFYDDEEVRQNNLHEHTFSEDSNYEGSQQEEQKQPSSQNQRQNQKQYQQNNNINKSPVQKNHLEQQHHQQKKKILAFITLDVGEGNSDEIVVKEGDNLNELARGFCIKHQLEDKCVAYISQSIEQQLKQRKKKKQNKAEVNDQAPPSTNTRKQNESPKFLQQQQQSPFNSHGQKSQDIHFNQQNAALKKQRPQQPSFGQNQFFEEAQNPHHYQKEKRAQYEQILEEEIEDQSNSLSGNQSIPEEHFYKQSGVKSDLKQRDNKLKQTPSNTGTFLDEKQRIMNEILDDDNYYQPQKQQEKASFDDNMDHNDEGYYLNKNSKSNTNLGLNKEKNNGINFNNLPNQNQNKQRNMQTEPSRNGEGDDEQNKLYSTRGDSSQRKETQEELEERNQIIQQISQRLNQEGRKKNLSQQQLNVQQQQQPQQKQSQPQNQGNLSTKHPNKKASSLQQQLEAKKEQFFNSYNANKKPNQGDTSISSEQEQISNQKRQNNEQQFEQPTDDSKQNAFKKSKSNNSLQQNVNTEVEDKSAAQQSYVHWQQLLSDKIKNVKQPNIPRRSPMNSPNSRKFQIGSDASPSSKKKPPKYGNFNNDLNISPSTITKNKSASLLSQDNSSSMQNFSQQQPHPNIRQNHIQQHPEHQPTLYDKLYKQGLQSMERKKRMYDDNLEKSKEREVIGTTFHPSISPQSRSMKLQEGVKIEDYLLIEGKKNKERKNIAQLVREEESIQECSFKPEVSIVSQKLVEHQQAQEKLSQQQQQKYSSVHERLYKQGEADKLIKEQWSSQQFKQIYPFSPDLGPNKNKKLPDKNQADFVNRLADERTQKEQRSVIQKQLESALIDPETGQPYFHPKINKDEVYQRVSKRIDLQDKLLSDELNSRSVSPLNSSQNTKQGRQITPQRIGQVPLEYQLRENRHPLQYDVNRIASDRQSQSNRSATPNRNSKNIEENGYVPLSSRAAYLSPQEEIENILSQSSFLRNKNITIKPSKNADQTVSIPLVNLSRFPSSNKQQQQEQQQQSTIQQFAKPNQPPYSNQNHKFLPSPSLKQFPSQNVANQQNVSQSYVNKSKSQVNLQPQNQSQFNNTQLQLSSISQFDNSRVFNDHKLSAKIAQLFDEFDSDKDGRISSLSIDISKTEPEILELIQNVLYEIDEKNLTLTRSQFTQFLSSNGLILPLKRYFAEKENQQCDEDMSDYDAIRFNSSEQSYLSNNNNKNNDTSNQLYSQIQNRIIPDHVYEKSPIHSTRQAQNPNQKPF